MLIIDKKKCTGCGACENICPNNCIMMFVDTEGFSYPSIDKGKCLNCGLCEDTCPVINKPNCTNELIPTAYAAWSLDEEVRINSTSGGIFTEIARVAIENGGYVVGAKYLDNYLVKHDIIMNESDISLLRQSKYVQSDIDLIFRRIKDLLDKDKIIMFVGTPCQCTGLIKFLGKSYDNLLICDFICRGVNSPKAYIKYLESLENQYKSSIKKVWFKNKTNGWNNFCTKIEFENGKDYYADRYTDLFMVGYLKYNLYMRPSCSNCSFKGFPRYSDITLADFWGVKLHDDSLDTNKGTSLVLINSPKGHKYFENLNSKIFKEASRLEAALPSNLCVVESVVKGEKRDYFFNEIDRLDFTEIMNKIIEMRTKNE